MSSHLVRDELIELACDQSGLNDFGDLPFPGPLDVLIESMNREAQLDATRRSQAQAMIVATLVKRLSFVNDRSLFPQIADEVITAPLFIVGAPRTGSTHYMRCSDRLLALEPRCSGR